MLRKDLILTPYQVWETAEAGAAAAFLTAATLPGDALPALVEECHACGLDALVEVGRHTVRIKFWEGMKSRGGVSRYVNFRDDDDTPRGSFFADVRHILKGEIATFSPTSRFIRLDLPTFGRPMTATNTEDVS